MTSNRDTLMAFRLCQDERERVRDFAAARGISQSDLIRESLRLAGVPLDPAPQGREVAA